MEREPVRILFHMNGWTKVVYERLEDGGSGMLADPTFDLPTRLIPGHLRAIGSRLLYEWKPFPRGVDLSDDEMRQFLARHTRVLEITVSTTEPDV